MSKQDRVYPPYHLEVKKPNCEKCGRGDERDAEGYLVRKVRLTIHHKDLNRHNNNPENLQTLCRKCHDKIHGM